MDALYIVRAGDEVLTSPGGDPYEIATVVLMSALVVGKKAEIFPASTPEAEPKRRRNVRISFEISVDADASSRLEGLPGSIGLDGDVCPPEDGLDIEAGLLESAIIGLIIDLWRESLDAQIEETHVVTSSEYAPEPQPF